MTIFTLQSSGPPVRVVYGGDGATLIVNRDLVNQVIYGDQSIVGDNSNSYSIIDPLGSITVDGQSDVYALGLSGNPTINVTNGAANWTPSPAQIAAQINALGIPETTAAYIATGTAGGTPGGSPLLRFTQNLGHGVNTAIPANFGSANIIPLASINQPSFELTIDASMGTNQGTVPFVQVQIQWFDSTSGLTTSTKHYWCPCGNGTGNAISCYITGPCVGNQVSVSVIDPDPTIVGTLTWTFNQLSDIFEHDRITQAAFGNPAVNGFTNPSGDPAAGILAISNPTINPSNTITRLAGVHSGPAILTVDNNSVSNTILVAIKDPATLYTSSSGVRMGTVRMPVSSVANIPLILPYGPVAIDIQNQTSTGTVTPNVALIATDQ